MELITNTSGVKLQVSKTRNVFKILQKHSLIQLMTQNQLKKALL